MKTLEERAQGLTLDQVKLQCVSKGLDITRDLIGAVHESSLMTSQKDLLKDALSLIDEMQETIDL